MKIPASELRLDVAEKDSGTTSDLLSVAAVPSLAWTLISLDRDGSRSCRASFRRESGTRGLFAALLSAREGTS